MSHPFPTRRSSDLLAVTINFPESGIVASTSTMSSPGALQTLEIQGLPEIVSFYADESLGPVAAGELSEQAWREVAAALIRDPELAQGTHTFELAASARLAAALDGEGSSDEQALAHQLKAEKKLAENFDSGFRSEENTSELQSLMRI